jgi:hypothetical protein
MSDTALNRIIQYGTTAERMAFTPDPAVGSQVLYIWYDTDSAPDTYVWDGSAWDLINADTGITQLTGDVTAGPGNGSQVATIPNDTVTYAKIQNVSATDRLLGRDTAAAGDIEEIPISSGLEFTGGPGLRVTAAARTQQIGITVDGGGSVLTTGIKGYKSFPVAGTITGWRLLADVAGDIEFDIFKDPFASYPPTTSIVAAAPPELVGVDNDEDTTLTGWTTAVSAGDVFGFEITGVPATIERVTLELTIVVT